MSTEYLNRSINESTDLKSFEAALFKKLRTSPVKYNIMTPKKSTLPSSSSKVFLLSIYSIIKYKIFTSLMETFSVLKTLPRTPSISKIQIKLSLKAESKYFKANLVTERIKMVINTILKNSRFKNTFDAFYLVKSFKGWTTTRSDQVSFSTVLLALYQKRLTHALEMMKCSTAESKYTAKIMKIKQKHKQKRLNKGINSLFSLIKSYSKTTFTFFFSKKYNFPSVQKTFVLYQLEDLFFSLKRRNFFSIFSKNHCPL